MLTEAKNYILEQNPEATVYLYGQEINPSAYAVAKSDMLLRGEESLRIAFGNSFSEDLHKGQRFDFMLSNPPFGVEWKKVEWVIKREYQTQGYDGRFGAGLPRINDGSLLFLQHILSKRKENGEESRIAIVFNGSPLFTGDAGSGESEIRRWIIENDWLEGIVALPDQLFYNTGINTYVWVLTNHKSARRRGTVQLVNAVDFYQKMPKSKGNKRNRIMLEQIAEITAIYNAFTEDKHCKIFKNIDFGYRKVRIDLPLKLNFQASPERIARLSEERAFQQLVESQLRDEDASIQEEELGRHYQEQILTMLGRLPVQVFIDRARFEEALRRTAAAERVKLTPAIHKAILSALGEKDPGAIPCKDKNGKIEPDPDLRDYENVPLKDGNEHVVTFSQFDERIPLTESVKTYLDREVFPFLPEAIIDPTYTDEKDNRVGRIGYEINFTRYFTRYVPPRPLEAIEAEIKTLEQDILRMLRDLTGGLA